MNKIKTTGALVAALLLSQALSHGAIIEIGDPAPSVLRTNGPYTIGLSFTVSANTTINALGAIDVGGNGFDFEAGTQAGLWNAAGTLLRSSTLTNSSTLGADNFRYETVADYTLVAGETYTIAAVAGSGVITFYDDQANPFIAGTNVTFTKNVYASGGTMTFPALDGGGTLGRWATANATYIVPEPGTYALLAGAFGLAFVMLRRRHA